MAASGNSDAALDTLSRIAGQNGKSMLLGRLVVDDTYGITRGRLADLLSKDLRRTTILLWIIWATASFSYYGVVLMSAELFEGTGESCNIGHDTSRSCSAQCQPLRTSDYNHLLWTTLAEFPGIMVSLLLIEKIGRKKTMAMEFFLFTITICLLFNCRAEKTVTTVILFFARALGSGLFQTAYVYTPEVYPTVLRSVGVGSCSGVARFGAMLTPYIAQVLMKQSFSGAVTVYVLCSLGSTFCCFLLPIETRNREMRENRQ